MMLFSAAVCGGLPAYIVIVVLRIHHPARATVLRR
jgi:hypothetical protein